MAGTITVKGIGRASANRVLFCNIAYMQYYDFSSIKEVPRHGGKYVAETGDAYEKHNFHLCDDGKVRGFVETKYVDGSASAQRPRQLRIENIDSAFKKENSINGVTVIFCAHSDAYKKTVIVGWYKDATVYRERPKYGDRQFNIECVADNAYLLPEAERGFFVPRATYGGIGFGQSNVWYAKDELSSGYVANVLKYIDDYAGPSLMGDDPIPQLVPDSYQESGIAKKVFVNKYERNPTARRRCLEMHGTSCVICGFNAADVYGIDFKDKIEVHHVVPIHEIGTDYKVDPEKDLIPVCPNCHMILHTKLSSGEYPTIDWIRTHIKK